MVNVGDCVSRYELARYILECVGINSCRVIPISSAEFPLPAPRPRMEAARNYQLELRNMDLMRDWHMALRSYLSRLYRLDDRQIAVPVEQAAQQPGLAAA
jgi:dTDP-4-dehydrorhamnose reductase